MSYKWIKNGSKLDNNPDFDYKIENTDDESHLRLKNLNRGDSGNYSCIASNAFGSDIQTSILYIKGLIKTINFNYKIFKYNMFLLLLRDLCPKYANNSYLGLFM